MSKLIIVCGLPGSGKTTLAKELSRKIKVACLHKDSVKECLYKSLGLSTLDESKKIGKPSVDVMLTLAEEQIEKGIDVIIESPFNFSGDYPLFESWKNKYQLQIYSIICSIDSLERKKRFSTRERNEAHHDDKRIFDFFVETEHDYAGIPGNQIRIETNKEISVLVDEILKKIGY